MMPFTGAARRCGRSAVVTSTLVNRKIDPDVGDASLIANGQRSKRVEILGYGRV